MAARSVLQVPADITTIGRGKAQRHILSVVHGAANGAEVPLVRFKSRYRGHFAGLMSAADALVKRGILTMRQDDFDGAVYRLRAHTHSGCES